MTIEEVEVAIEVVGLTIVESFGTVGVRVSIERMVWHLRRGK